MPPTRSKPLPAGPASHAASDAATRTPGTGTDTQGSSDWLAEAMNVPGGPASRPQAPEGVPIATRGKRERRRGRAIESKRQRR